MQYILTLHAESRLSLSGISTSTPPFFLLLSAFQPHLQTPKWFWQLEECTNTTARTFEVITNRVYYFMFIIITIWQVIQMLGHISNGNAVGCSADDDCGGNVCCNISGPSWAKKPYHPESWPHTDYLLLLNSAKKSLWTVLFWQLNVAKLLSSFLGLFLWGGRDRKRRYFYENGYNWELTPFLYIYIYIKCNKEQKGEGRIG